MAKLKNRKDKLQSLNQLGKISKESLEEVREKAQQIKAEERAKTKVKATNTGSSETNNPKEETLQTSKSSTVDSHSNTTNVERMDKAGKQPSTETKQEINQMSPNLMDSATVEKSTSHSATIENHLQIDDQLDRPIQDIDISLLDSAPEDWNRFPALSEDRRAQLKLSIEASGLFNPILVWKQENGRYMILSGHNRVSIYKELYQDAVDEKYNGSYDIGTDDIAKYSKIPCIVYQTDELTARKAREIIIDTNFIQRGELSARLRAEILEARADIYKDQKNKKGKNIKEIAEELGIKKTVIYEDFQIIEKVAEPFRKLYYHASFGRKAILKLASVSLELQQKIYELYGTEITEKQLLGIKKGMSEEALLELFTQEETIIDKQVRLKVPSNREAEFKKIHKYFIEQPDEAFISLVRQYLEKKA